MKYLPLICLSSFVMSAAALVAAENAVQTTPAVIKLGIGYDYSKGDYGFTQDTEVSSIPVNLSYDQDRWAFKATLPYITIKGPATVVTGSGAASGAPPRPTTNSESGFGDIMLSGTYHARPVPGELNVDLTGRVKFGTADVDKGLGTGKTDYYAQIDLYQNFGVLTPFGNVGYRVLGRSDEFPLKDGFYATVGSAVRISSTTVGGVAFDWRSKIVSGAQDGTDGLAFISTNPNAQWNLLAYVLKGFNDASPNIGVGGSATYKF
jgi:hypothetical protein